MFRLFFRSNLVYTRKCWSIPNVKRLTLLEAKATLNANGLPLLPYFRKVAVLPYLALYGGDSPLTRVTRFGVKARSHLSVAERSKALFSRMLSAAYQRFVQRCYYAAAWLYLLKLYCHLCSALQRPSVNEP